MELTPGAVVHGFSISERTDLPEIDGEAIVGVHEASQARLLYLKNDDANKSFAIGFKTPPKDDTGVFHILEHSVLCGSRRFPVKEPFVDLLKSSMQTFLNAMTFADKTLYPVSSTNEQDLFNLMDVYLDAVFHPSIYEKRAIFEQEGWHYELKALPGAEEGANVAALGADETALVYNGVVYNEMKGALSDSSSVLYDELQKALFPDTCYAFESGGTPKAIPTLSYENYLDEHARHYRTDNSYIILYGDLDIDRALAFLDERYLTPVAKEQREADAARVSAGLEPLVARDITMQEPRQAGYVRKTMDTAPENAVAASAYVIGGSAQRTRVMAVDILLDALFGSNEAPLKRALLDAGVAHDVTAFVSDALLQPFVVVQANMPAEGQGARLADTLSDEVRRMLDSGLDKSLIEAALSHSEFVMREHDMGYADGVIYSMVALSSWLYDDDAPLDYLRYERDFAELRKALDTDYFERLCAELFLDNDHVACVEVVPTPGVSDDDTPERLAETNRTLAPEERERIVEDEARLRELQEAPDSPEARSALPRLGVSDIGEPAEEPSYAIEDGHSVPCLRHDVATRGVAYAYRYFDASCVSYEDLPYMSVLSLVLGKLDTASHTAAELDTLAQGKLGNLTFFAETLGLQDDVNAVMPKFVVSASALSANAEWLACLPREVMLETDFSDTDKILDVLKQRKIMLEQMFSGAGHQCAMARCRSYFSRTGMVRERLGNVDFYRFICDLLDHYDERSQELSKRLHDMAQTLFCDDGCMFSFAGDDVAYERFWAAGPECGRSGDKPNILVVPEPEVKNEAFVVPSDVCFAAVAWDRRLNGDEYTGSWAVAGKALSLDYLWNEVRVKGGAYGVGFQALRMGAMRFYTYRDPHLDESLARFERVPEWLEDFDPGTAEFEGYVVACVAAIDAPCKPREIIRRQGADYLCGRTPEQRLETRRQVVATDKSSVRAFAGPVSRMLDAHAICAFGNREILESSNAGLKVIELIG